MSAEKLPLEDGPIEEVSALIETLVKTGRRLEDLTAGEVDTVTSRDGRTVMLRRAQDQLRHSESARQSAILNALPAHIALLDGEGSVVSMNEVWRQFAGANPLQGPGCGIGVNYLELCDRALAEGMSGAREAVEGIRSVLSGAATSFSIEYACHSPAAQRWFLLTVTPLALDRPNGVVVMHADITERKRGEVEVRRFAAAMDALADAIVLVDRSSMRIVHANDAACRHMGKTREQLLMLDLWVWLSTSRAALEQSYDTLIASGAPEAPVEMLRRKDGADRWVELRRHAALSEDRWIIVTIARDITERKQARQALAESERRLSDMLANVELLAVMLDREVRITYCNDHFLRLTGWRAEEVIGQSWVEKFIPPESDLKERLATLLTDRPEARHGESVILTRSGERLLIRWNNSLLRNAAGDVNGTASIGEDITEQRRGEEALRRFSAAMDATPDAIYLTDRASMRFIHVNEAACRMQGQRREELLALGPDGVLSVSRAELERTYDALIASGVDAEPVELLRARKDGSQVWVEMRRHAQRMGDRWTIITLVRDVTERRQAEAKIVRLNRVYAVLSGINTAIVRIREREDLFREVCRIAVSEGGFSLARVLELDANAKVRIAATSEPDSRTFQGVVDDYNSDPEHSQSLLAIAMRERQPVISNDVAADARIPHRAALTRDGNYALALLPIIVDQSVVGAVVLRTREAGIFDEAELHLLLELVSNLSFALEHMEKARKLDRSTRVNAMLSGINTAIVRIRDRQALFEEACRIAVETGGFTLAWIGVVDAEASVLVPVAWAGPGREYADKLRLKVGDAGPDTRSLAAQAIREKRAGVANDVAHDPRVVLLKEMVEHGMGSVLVLPLVVHGNALGTLTLVAAESGFFDVDELILLNEVTGNIAFALEHIEKEKKVQRLTRVYAVLSGINALIVRVHDRDELFREACRIAVEAGRFPLAWIAVADPHDQRVKAAAWAGDESGFLELNRQTVGASGQGKPGLGAQAIEKCAPVLCNDIAADGSAMRYPKEALARGYRSAAALPLVVDGTAIAALVLYAAEANSFDDEETKLLVELAGDISFALAQIKRATKLDRLTRMNAMLSGINGAIVRLRDRQALFDEACRIAVETGGLRFAWLNLVDEVELRLRPVASAGVVGGFLHTAPARLSLRPDAPEGHGIAARSVLQNRALVENDVETAVAVVDKDVHAERGIKSMAAFPLFIAGRVVGNLVLHAAEAGFFDDDEMKLLSEVAANIAFALEHIEKEEGVQRLTRVYAVLSSINTLIVRVRDRDELFTEACRVAVEAGHFLKAWIGIVGTGAQPFRMVAAHGADPLFFQSIERQLNRKLSAGKGLVVRALATGKPVISNDAASDPEMLLEDDTIAAGVRSVVILPLIVAGEAIGVLTLSADTVGFFDDEEMKLLAELAGDIAFAIDHIDKRDRLDYLAYYDPLTGLANRSLFLERVAPYMRSAATDGHKLAVFLIDLERFRNINDSLGRPAGDALLKQVAEWLTRKAGDASLLARVGTDQFAVVLPEVKEERSVARLIQNWMDASLAHPFRLNDAVFRIAAKVGVALFPEDGADADLLFRNAEAALKKAKTSGQRYLFYTQTMTDAVTGKLTLENQLRQALDNEEFVLHYQPKVSLQSGKLVGVEALIRWNDPLTGLVPPGRFVPVLEETGMIQAVGRWALRKAIEDYLRWRAAGLPAVRIAVNVSPLQLHSRGFIAEIEEAIGIAPLAAAGLELEITESVIMEDVKHNIASLQAIRAMGVTIAIDDFGTGFSSLSYLARLPVDTLKIDRSFVIDLTEGPQGLALVSTIISLAHALKLKVVAEGVETEEQARLLRLLSCDEMQGFLFSKPLPGEIFAAKYLTLPVAA